ncbi:hypothetical protein Aab01nite_11780 [Paractinoplanes abujensis]|uniref:Uncharacterized protein n=1 Tax=Paractinoplanes abujensis TaxID=882441 RepID=A0A7W7FZW8_9ACTN|nr:hypothetical protein [Actinoplanes abujensis]MBB4690999.1 hypothetical protein [Actinoplanes abujensis]GID17588.1 hypothetical protein Aab01nite_11780 [Actinoplanes abujensis]
MSGDKYDQMLREADPYRPGPFIAADQELLTQIMAEPRRQPFSRLAVVGVAAAVIIAAVGVVVVLNRTSAAPTLPAAPTPSAASPSRAGPPPASDSLLEPQKVKKAAEQGSRLVIGEPGWKIIHLEPFADDGGEMAWEKGDRMINSSWYPAAEYNSRRHDKQKGAEKVKLGDYTGWMITEGGQFRVMTEPQPGGKIMVSFDSGPGFTKARFRTFLAGVKTVGVEAWIAAATGTVSRRGEMGDRAYRLFAHGGLGRPQSWEDSQLDDLPVDGTLFDFDTALAKQAACGFITDWEQAKARGNAALLEAVRETLLASKNWTVLKDLEQQGSTLRTPVIEMTTRLASDQATPSEIEVYRRQFCPR